MAMHCIGCGSGIAWDGQGAFSYTHSCGSIMFADENSKVALPASLVMAAGLGKKYSHLDYYLGKSAFRSPEKDEVERQLRRLGSIWSWECGDKKCRTRSVERAAYEREHNLYHFEFHPRLEELVAAQEVIRRPPTLVQLSETELADEESGAQ